MKNGKKRKAPKEYLGAVITPKNRKIFFERYRNDFLLKEEKNKNSTLNVHEKEQLADAYARVEIKKQNEHLKAYIKGEKFYTVYGRAFPVISPEIFTKQIEEEE